MHITVQTWHRRRNVPCNGNTDDVKQRLHRPAVGRCRSGPGGTVLTVRDRTRGWSSPTPTPSPPAFRAYGHTAVAGRTSLVLTPVIVSTVRVTRTERVGNGATRCFAVKWEWKRFETCITPLISRSTVTPRSVVSHSSWPCRTVQPWHWFMTAFYNQRHRVALHPTLSTNGEVALATEWLVFNGLWFSIATDRTLKNKNDC